MITLNDNSHGRTENNKMSRPHLHCLEPGPHVFSEDVVLDNRGEPGLAILGRNQRRQPIAEIQKPPGLILVLIPRMRPSAYCPSRELASSHMDAAFELTSKQVCN